LEGKVNLLIRDLVPVTLKLTPKPFGIGALLIKEGDTRFPVLPCKMNRYGQMILE